VARHLVDRLGRLGRRDRKQQEMEALRLTPRQMEVLRLISRGLGNGQVADRLGLSPYTVKNHVHNILECLGVSDRTEAVAYAYRRRWLV
jgi:two-component system NarL family response regulator